MPGGSDRFFLHGSRYDNGGTYSTWGGSAVVGTGSAGSAERPYSRAARWRNGCRYRWKKPGMDGTPTGRVPGRGLPLPGTDRAVRLRSASLDFFKYYLY